MSTRSIRSITHIHEMFSLNQNKIVCSFYRHHDGYPSGHGQDLAYWLRGKGLTNGVPIFPQSLEGKQETFNRAGSMAIQLMSYIQDISGCEVVPSGTEGMGEEYVYDVFFDDDEGRQGEFLIWCRDVVRSVAHICTADEFDGKEIELVFSKND